MGILYATDNGADGDRGRQRQRSTTPPSPRQASQYAYDHGVVQTFSGDDLNTGNHNYPANYGHAMLIQGTVPDTVGLGEDAGSQWLQALRGSAARSRPPAAASGTTLPVGTYFRGANTTQYGGKSSISMEGTTGSENTGKAAGAAALVVSAAPRRDAVDQPAPRRDARDPRADRRAVTTGNTGGAGTPDPGADPTAPAIDQWTTHFGWGRVEPRRRGRASRTAARSRPRRRSTRPTGTRR